VEKCATLEMSSKTSLIDNFFFVMNIIISLIVINNSLLKTVIFNDL